MAGQSYKGPLDYIDVAARIVDFRKKHPEGSLTRIGPDGSLVDVEFREFGGKTWVVYTAFAYRSPDDMRPGVGTAWEPVPGPTQFTRDSEVQNAETAAWGRAIVAALAGDTKKGIASAEEIRNRQQKATGQPIPTLSDADRIRKAAGALRGAQSADAVAKVWVDIEKSRLHEAPELVAIHDDLVHTFSGDGTQWDPSDG
ncbi:hypothetical protein [Microbacterium terrisoli]|uniref:hypothetical protein n=1 Tax=Microbacterium terrisoli TaxID=3242192 RepID=UPI0028045008|nr:hypothetical protein [Microbacterium protaetiae]